MLARKNVANPLNYEFSAIAENRRADTGGSVREADQRERERLEQMGNVSERQKQMENANGGNVYECVQIPINKKKKPYIFVGSIVGAVLVVIG